MEIRIGVVHTNKEIEIELPEDADLDQLATDIETAIDGEGTGPAQGAPKPTRRSSPRAISM